MDNKTSTGLSLGVAAVAIAVIALGFSLFGHSSSGNVGGERAGLQEFIDGAKTGDLNSKWIAKAVAPGSNQVLLYRNTSGHDVIADYGDMTITTGSTASSTSKISLFATTSSSVGAWADFGTVVSPSNLKLALINAEGVATSSTATTTNAVSSAVHNKGSGAVLVPNNSYLFGYIQQDTTACGALTTACETATSSNRGFNPLFHVHIDSVASDRPTL